MCRLIDARNVGEVGDDSSGSSLSSPVVTIDLSGGDEGSMTVRRQYDFDDDEYDPEGRKTMLMCPAPMTSKGDQSGTGFALDANLCGTPCYKAKIALR